MASNVSRPGRTLAVLGVVVALLLAVVAVGGDWSPRLGLDLQGGTRITLQASSTSGEDITPEKLDQAQEIIAARVNGTGVASAEVSTRGGEQIIVEIPGEQRGDIVDQVGRTAQLRFRLVWSGPGPGQPLPETPTAPGSEPDGGGNGDGNGAGSGTGSGAGGGAGSDAGNTGGGGAGSDAGGGAGSDAGNTGGGAPDGGGGNTGGSNNRALSGWMLPDDTDNPSDNPDDPTGNTTDAPSDAPSDAPGDGPADAPSEAPTDTATPDAQTPAGGPTDASLADITLDEMIETTLSGAPPTKYTDAFSKLTQEYGEFTCPEADSSTAVDDQPAEPLITCDVDGAKYLLSPAVIEGTSLTDASAGLPQQSPQWVVNLELDGDGTDVFSDVTQALVQTGKLFAIVLDGQVLSAPQVTNPITNGQAQISGGFTQETATELANSLQYGALPLSFEVSGVDLAGPTLAGSQLSAGILAGIIGLVLVVIYCLLYYRGLGIVVVASLAVSAVLTYELVILLGNSVGFTLTLPGIAGLIVAVGITADSFIIFFERLRDEVREGKSLRLAVESGWKRARATILAADAVSLLAAVILYIFAIDEIRGFAFALGLTTLLDVVVVFFFTKPLVSLLARTAFFGRGHKLSGLDPGHLGIEGRNVNELAHAAPRPRPQGATR